MYVNVKLSTSISLQVLSNEYRTPKERKQRLWFTGVRRSPVLGLQDQPALGGLQALAGSEAEHDVGPAALPDLVHRGQDLPIHGYLQVHCQRGRPGGRHQSGDGPGGRGH